jgi:hypothetical protein
MEISLLKLLLLELMWQCFAMVAQLHELLCDQWCDIMCTLGLPVLLSISAGQIALLPVCLVLDN